MNTLPGPQALPRELVLASAGSGKTYHLSSRILGLLAGGAPPGEVLATTFTRKAAGEILERVLMRLAEGASDPEKAKELGRTAHENLAEPIECRQLLARLLSELHQLNVGTLDAFFVRLAQSFFQELGLSPGWTIADEPTEKRLRTEAVQDALSGADRAEMVELLRMLTRGDADRRVHTAILKHVDTLLSIHRQLDPRAVDPWSPGFGVTERLPGHEIEAKSTELAARLSQFDIPTTKTGNPRKAWEKARDRAFPAIAARDWETALKGGVGAKVVQGEDQFDGEHIPPEFVDLFHEVRSLARIDLAHEFRRESQAMGRLAELLATAFAESQRRIGAYRFEDITYLLGGPDPTGSREDLHYRLDQRVRHLLLDEFQDTSLEQWRALEPLAHELLSGHLDERAGVIVADTKQSVYGWRGARPELVRQVSEQHGLTEKTMEHSWRSSQVVLDFVADVFRDCPNNPVISSMGVGQRVAADWMADFTELKAAREVPGHACVHLAPRESGPSPLHPDLLRYSAQLVQKLHAQMPDRSIGVLARRNKVVGHLMDELSLLGVRASGEGGTSLTDTAPVNAILSLLRLADHPGHRAALYHVARTPLGEVVGLRDHKNPGAARELAHRIRNQLLRDGYGSSLARWARDLAPHCDNREVQRLLQLVELGHRWDERSTLRPTDFTRYVTDEPVEDPSSAPVQVMTVHRSKGMEFDVVVLPELYGSLSPKGEGVAIPERDPDTNRVVRVYPRIEQSVRMLFPEVDVALQKVKAAELRDELSVLYVALTRAKYALHLVIPPEGSSTKHSAALVSAALVLKDAEVSEAGILLELGDSQWSVSSKPEDAIHQPADLIDPLAEPAAMLPIEPVEALGPAEGQSEKAVGHPPPRGVDLGAPIFRPSAAGLGRNLARRSPSSLEGGDRVDLASTLRLDRAGALHRGDVVHAWCKNIGWIESGIGEDAALVATARATSPSLTKAQVAELIAEFRGWMDAEAVRSALSRGHFPSDLFTVAQVENELPFARRVDGEIQEGFIDRLVLIQRDGVVVGAEVLDFKTDMIEPGDDEGLADRTEQHRPQISAYCDVVREQYGLAAGDVSGFLVFLVSGEVREVVREKR